MAAFAPEPAATLDAAVARIGALMRDFSLEATRPGDTDIAALAVLAPGSRVYISAVPNRAAAESIDAAIRLRAAGFEPVPHVAVRNFADAAALQEFLARLNGEAGARRALIVAGDRAECGAFRNSLDAIASGVFDRCGIGAIDLAGYPDGHPRIGEETLFGALADKIAAAQMRGLKVEIVTQFCFEAPVILDYVARLRARGFTQALHIGLAGPATPAALLRYATRCGVRASAQALAARSGLIRQMLSVTEPDALMRALADAGLAGVTAHFFSFGGVAASARWARAVADGRIALDGASGFRVGGA